MVRLSIRAAFAAFAVVAALALVACGGDDDSETTGTQADQAPASAPPETAVSGQEAAGNHLTLAADPGGALSYEPDSLTASAGEVTVDFTNQSDTGHSVVFERDGEDVAGTEVITDSSASVTFDAEPGEYRFYCSVPGHAEAGMEGTLTVE